jgi:hypothetical protein
MWQSKWEESGFETYKKSISYIIEKTAAEADDVLVALKLERYKLCDCILNQFWYICNRMMNWPMEA